MKIGFCFHFTEILKSEFAAWQCFLEKLKVQIPSHCGVFPKFCGDYFGGAPHSKVFAQTMVFSSRNSFTRKMNDVLANIAYNGTKIGVFLITCKEGFSCGGVNRSTETKYFSAHAGVFVVVHSEDSRKCK